MHRAALSSRQHLTKVLPSRKINHAYEGPNTIMAGSWIAYNPALLVPPFSQEEEAHDGARSRARARLSCTKAFDVDMDYRYGSRQPRLLPQGCVSHISNPMKDFRWIKFVFIRSSGKQVCEKLIHPNILDIVSQSRTVLSYPRQTMDMKKRTF